MSSLEPNKTVAGCIDIFNDTWVYPENTIKIVESICQDPERKLVNWDKADFMGPADAKFRRQCSMLNITKIKRMGAISNPMIHNIYDTFHTTIIDYVRAYMLRYAIGDPCYNNSPYQMIKYEVGDEYPKHYDGPTRLGRHISAILYLNDDYEGGELHFPIFDVTIKPIKGQLILFPSNYAYQHLARPVTAGTKYAIVTWMHDRPDVRIT